MKLLGVVHLEALRFARDGPGHLRANPLSPGLFIHRGMREAQPHRGGGRRVQRQAYARNTTTEHVNRDGEIVVENCAFFGGVRLECLQGGRIFIGNGTYLNRNTEVIAAEQVHIGQDCKIAWDVVIMDTDQHGASAQPIPRPVWIGDRVWIGCRAIILKGVTIGDDAVIGAGAIVTKDVPPGAIVAAKPTPSATANAPTRPMNFAWFMMVSLVGGVSSAIASLLR